MAVSNPTIVRLGPTRKLGGTLFVCITTPFTRVKWTITGDGTITPITDFSNDIGHATAIWKAPDPSVTQAYTVTATVHL